MMETGQRFLACRFHNPAWLEPLNLRGAVMSATTADTMNNISSFKRCDTLELISRSNYALLYDKNLRMALWCGFYLNSRMVRAARLQRKTHVCYTDKTLPKEIQVQSSHMQRRAYDKGHMAPLASVATCVTTAFEASLVSNFVLQHKALNRGIWKRLEHLSRCYVEGYGFSALGELFTANQYDEPLLPLAGRNTWNSSRCLAVSTGVLFRSEKNSLNCLLQQEKQAVPIPDELYMALWDVHSHQHIAFIVPNDETAAIRSLKPKRLHAKGQKGRVSPVKKTRIRGFAPLHKHIQNPLDKTDLSDINRFRVTLKELEHRIALSERVIAEKLLCIPHGARGIESINATKCLGRKNCVVEYQTPPVELFSLQKRRRAWKMAFTRSFLFA
ncbi:DNA/RNA non-specific endonuclease protein [Trypanosoma conorhini]|uniref:DNA/RNA non-specific endonuclease protein n=1 Tax=Trypanosoma conorhini TaxID=83891 RepID=A0A422NFV2_9TRYP|nr:DNA/RNA non-specific endonuclease protein [Trypanosoma conorhini]RNF04317.1 DNA/RNA non-specific endonuclease protein [Trypanosoma conorhini]